MLSILGYGKIFTNFVFKKNLDINLAITGFFGLFFLFIISFLTHIFLSHENLHNSVVILVGIFAFIIFFKRSNIEELKIIFIIFLILFLGFIISKTNEDFPYYHFPVTLQLVHNKLVFGLGNIDIANNHFSSIFFINSLFYLPIIKYYLFNLTDFFLQVFFFSSLIFFFREIPKNNFLKFFIFSTFIVFIIKFYRLSEFGVDMPGQFLTIVGTILSLKFYLEKKNNILNFSSNEVYVFLYIYIFAVTTKFLYSIYFIIPAVLIFHKFGLISSFKILKNSKFLLISFFSLASILFFNFSTSGCLLYPVKFTCILMESDWTLSNRVMDDVSIHYEAWAKGGKGPSFQVENLEQYVSGINWVNNWLKVYFFTKFSDFILLNFFIFLIFYLVFLKNINEVKSSISFSTFFIFYLSLFIVFIIWFFNFPTLRYAGYSIVYQLISFPFCYFFSRKIELSNKIILKRLHVLLLISVIIFNSRNVIRINGEMNIPNNMNHNFTNFPFFWIDTIDYKKIDEDINLNYVLDGKPCWNVTPICVRGKDIKFYKKRGYIFLYKK